MTAHVVLANTIQHFDYDATDFKDNKEWSRHSLSPITVHGYD